MNTPERRFLHIDIDAFFASVEQLDHPEWKGRPVIVGGLPTERRSVVSTASYEARKFGVHSAMPAAEAYRLCPHGIFTPVRMQRYAHVSADIMDILASFSPDIRRLSIDEACLDITGTEGLFGLPEELSRTVKAKIFERTGLTVSAGVASTRYLAKMASEINKPDGFYCIPSGSEQDFMLSMPLEKIWGIGKKTRARLNAAGLYTAHDIYRQSQSLLSLMFGKATGAFLFNTVRGKETERQSPPSHSMSAETTYPYDIEDRYAAETALMELCQPVMFRLLEKKLCSRTVTVKIRYEDFTTLSVSATEDAVITSADDLFMRAKAAFERKYDSRKGIRLLGVAAEHVMDAAEGGTQEALFDFGEKRKQAVEAAILELQSKHPDIKIKKARLLAPGKKLPVIFFFAALALFGMRMPLHAAETNTQKSGAGTILSPKELFLPPLPAESPVPLFNYTLFDKEIEFLANGYWKGELTGGVSATFGGGTTPAFSAITPVFKQETDLSLFFRLNKKWYFETAFSDRFEKNTIAAGFTGSDDDIVKNVRIANRGIAFPTFYSLDAFGLGIGGGKNQAPGILAHLGDRAGQRWRADAAVRYDMVQTKSALFYGSAAVSEKAVELSDYVTGQLFALDTEEQALSVAAVYVEDKNGAYKDTDGRKYRKLPRDSWAAEGRRRIVMLSKYAGAGKEAGRLPAVAFEFTRRVQAAEFGSYDTPHTFLGKIQKRFRQSAPELELSHFSYNLDVTIDGKPMLLVQSDAGFSPFACAFRYDCGQSASADVSVASKTTGSRTEAYTAVEADYERDFMRSDFFSEKHFFADVFKEGEEAAGTDYSDPSIRYPLAGTEPYLYLRNRRDLDIALLIRTYTPVSRYDIGTEAAENSVRVYRNGALDASARYDKASGSVHIPSAGANDKIDILWHEDNPDHGSARISAAGAFMYNFLPELTGDFATAVSWPVAPEQKYAEFGKDSPGYAALSTGIRYQKGDELLASNAAAASFETANTRGKYRILGMDKNKRATQYFGKYAAHTLPEGFAPALNARAYTASFPLAPDLNRTLSADAEADTSISGYRLPLAWQFTGAPNEWAAISFAVADDLEAAEAFVIALKRDAPISDCDIYVQLGAQDDESEYRDKVPTWKISGSAPLDSAGSFDAASGTKNGQWQEVRLTLNDADRAKIRNASRARLIVHTTSPAAAFGKIYVGPYEVIRSAMAVASSKRLFVSSEETKDSSAPDSGDFNSGDNMVQKIAWQDAGIRNYDDTLITAAASFKPADIASYKNVKLSFKYDAPLAASPFVPGSEAQPSADAFIVTLDADAPAIGSSGKTAVQAAIRLSEFARFQDGQWHTLSVDLHERKLQIDGQTVSSRLEVHANRAPTRLKITFTAAKKSGGSSSASYGIASSGALYLDELHLDGSPPTFVLRDKITVNLEKKDALYAIGQFPLVAEPFFRSTLLGQAVIPPEKEITGSRTLESASEAGITLLGVNVRAGADFSSAQRSLFVSGLHRINTASPLGGVFSFDEQFSFEAAGNSSLRSLSAETDMGAFHVPLKIGAAVKNEENGWNKTQSEKALLESNIGIRSGSLKITAAAENNQKKNAERTRPAAGERDYFTAFKDATLASFSDGWADSATRSVKGEASIGAVIPFAGLTPVVGFCTEGRYAAAPKPAFSDATAATLTVPFTVRKNNFSFSYAKEGGGSESSSIGGTYGRDWNHLKDALGGRNFYFSAAPFYDFFTPTLPDRMREERRGSSVFYASAYEFLWKRAIFMDVRDLLAPSSAGFSARRDIRASDSITDIYQLKLNTIHTAINMFGAKSALAAFRWYDTDEFTLSLVGTARIPASAAEETLYTVSAYGQAALFFSSTDFLKGGAEVRFDSKGNWSTEETLVWKRAGRKSILKTAAEAALRKKADGITLLRTNSVNLAFAERDKIFTQKYELTHRLDLKMLKYFTLNCILSGAYASADKNTASRISITATLGGKCEFR